MAVYFQLAVTVVLLWAQGKLYTTVAFQSYITLYPPFRTPAQAANCPYPNGYFPDSSRCDKFLECRDGVAEEVTCPDGLLVNEKAAAFRYPCDYPVDVDCGSRTAPCKLYKYCHSFLLS